MILRVNQLKKSDVLFVLSGSGKTSSLVAMATNAKSIGAYIFTITLQQKSEIGNMADLMIILPGTTRLQDKISYSSIQPIDSSFEQIAWLTCDGLILKIKEKIHLENEHLIKNYANLE